MGGDIHTISGGGNSDFLYLCMTKPCANAMTHPEERDVDGGGGHVGGYLQAAPPVLGAGGGQVAGHLAALLQGGGEQRQGAGEGAIGGGLVTVRRSEEVSRGTAHLVLVTLVRDGATLHHLAEPPADSQSGDEEQCWVR